MILYQYTFELYRYIEYRDISMYRPQNVSTDAVVVHCVTALKLFPAYNLRKSYKNQ